MGLKGIISRAAFVFLSLSVPLFKQLVRKNQSKRLRLRDSYWGQFRKLFLSEKVNNWNTKKRVRFSCLGDITVYTHVTDMQFSIRMGCQMHN